jgi:hypothetical protein
VAATVREARRAGFDNLSLDLLYDLPGQTVGSWRETLAAALTLEPEHVSAYALSLDDPDTEGLTGPAGDHLPLRPGARRWRERARTEQDGDRAADMYLLADEMLAALAWAGTRSATGRARDGSRGTTSSTGWAVPGRP